MRPDQWATPRYGTAVRKGPNRAVLGRFGPHFRPLPDLHGFCHAGARVRDSWRACSLMLKGRYAGRQGGSVRNLVKIGRGGLMGRAQGLAPFLIVLGVYRCVQVICPGRPHVSASRKGIHQLLRIDGSWCPVCLRLIIRASPGGGEYKPDKGNTGRQ